MDWLFSRRRQGFTVEHLRDLYAELLVHIEIAHCDHPRENADPAENRVDSRGIYSSRRSLVHNLSSEPATGKTLLKTRDLATAFRVLSATHSADKEGENGGAVAMRDDATVSALSTARTIETRVVKLIRRLGEVVAYGNQSGATLRSDDVFEYFCDKKMLALLVDVAKAKPSDGYMDSSNAKFHEVVWSPQVKAQVFHTIYILISNTQEAPSLYYLLSNDHLNELVMGFLPLRQWTDPALEEMLPLYATFLKSLAALLSASPALFSFLTRVDPQSALIRFPLFSATTEVVTTQSDPVVHATCFSQLVDLMKISHPPIRSWVSNANREHRVLAMHICQRLVDRYERLVKLTTGPVVDPVRSNAIAGQLASLQGQIEAINDILWCGVRTLNVRLCECLLQRLVSILLRNLIPTKRRQLLAVGSTDADVIPEREALAQVSTLFLAQLFMTLAYPPFLRMLTVALLHPMSSSALSAPISVHDATSEQYVLTKALNQIVQSKEEDFTSQGDDQDLDPQFVANPYRSEILTVLKGHEGEWRFIPMAILLESMMKSDALGLDVFSSMKVIPHFPSAEMYPKSIFEEALSDFLERRQVKSSAVSVLAQERAGALALAMLPHVVTSMSDGGNDARQIRTALDKSALVKALRKTRCHFYSIALKFKDVMGVSQLHVDLVELAIKERYQKLGDKGGRQGKPQFGCPLAKYSCFEQSRNADILVRKHRNVGSNDVEDARFAIKMALHFRGLCRAVECSFQRGGDDNITESAGQLSPSRFKLKQVDSADDLLLTIGDLKTKPSSGTDLDLRGRTTFLFVAASSSAEPHNPKAGINTVDKLSRTAADDVTLHPSSQLVLVLDPTDIFVVKPINKKDMSRGTIVCRAPLRSVIACASDGAWLHVAVRQMEDIGFLIKNGNMALGFDSVGTCLIVHQYIEKSREALRKDLMEKVQLLFKEEPNELIPTETICNENNVESVDQRGDEAKVEVPNETPTNDRDVVTV